jgi:hypothetical protein
MNRYPTGQSTFSQLFKRSCALHYLTLKHTLLCVLLIAVIQYGIFLADALPVSFYVKVALDVLALALIVFLFSAALLASHRAFIDQSDSMASAIKNIAQRIKPILAIFCLYIIGGIVVYFAAVYLVMLIDRLLHESPVLHGGALILVAALLILYVVAFYFSAPLVIVDEKRLPSAFYHSLILSEKNKLGVLVTLGIVGIVLTLMHPTTATLYGAFLIRYHLVGLFDAVILCIAMPLYINLLLLLVNDSKYQVNK